LQLPASQHSPFEQSLPAAQLTPQDVPPQMMCPPHEFVPVHSTSVVCAVLWMGPRQLGAP
jgi:hypothetical protein